MLVIGAAAAMLLEVEVIVRVLVVSIADASTMITSRGSLLNFLLLLQIYVVLLVLELL